MNRGPILHKRHWEDFFVSFVLSLVFFHLREVNSIRCYLWNEVTRKKSGRVLGIPFISIAGMEGEV